MSRGTKQVVFFSLFGLVLTVALSLMRPLEFSSSVRLLVVQKVTPADAYTAIRSVETISDNLAEVVKTTSFFERVVASEANVRRGYFSRDERTRRKQWARMIDTQTSRGSGFLRVTAYHPDRREARKVVDAISSVLIAQGWEYVNADILIKVVDAPLDSRFPVRPNLAVNAILGAIFGAALGFVYGAQSGRHSKLAALISHITRRSGM